MFQISSIEVSIQENVKQHNCCKHWRRNVSRLPSSESTYYNHFWRIVWHWRLV